MTKKNNNELDCIKIETASPVNAAMIWLHGLGASGEDFVPFVSELKLPAKLGIRFLFPHAPMMPVTINNGYIMRAWYDIYGLSEHAKIDHAGIERSRAIVKALLQQQIASGIDPNRIILAGFSQGAVMALSVGLTHEPKLAGIVALSGYLPYRPHELKLNYRVPTFLGHGLYDEVVSYAFAEMARDTLTAANVPLTFKSYAIGHSVNPEEINDIRDWLLNVLSDGRLS